MACIPLLEVEIAFNGGGVRRIRSPSKPLYAHVPRFEGHYAYYVYLSHELTVATLTFVLYDWHLTEAESGGIYCRSEDCIADLTLYAYVTRFEGRYAYRAYLSHELSYPRLRIVRSDCTTCNAIAGAKSVVFEVVKIASGRYSRRHFGLPKPTCVTTPFRPRTH